MIHSVQKRQQNFPQNTFLHYKQEGQHPLTGQRAANFRQDLEAT